MSREDGNTPKRKNAREDFRLITDAEAFGQELELAIRGLQSVAAKLIPEHEAESADRAEPIAPEDFLGQALHALGRVKGRMYLERVARGFGARELAPGSGWSEHTLRQFENREADALVSSLFRYAAGMRAAGIPGRIEIHWVPDEPARSIEGRKAA